MLQTKQQQKSYRPSLNGQLLNQTDLMGQYDKLSLF